MCGVKEQSAKTTNSTAVFVLKIQCFQNKKEAYLSKILAISGNLSSTLK